MSDSPEDFVDYLAENDRGLAPCKFHGMQEKPCPECFGIDHSKDMTSPEAADEVGFTSQYFVTIARRLGIVGRKTGTTHGGTQFLWTKNDIIAWKRGKRRLERAAAEKKRNGKKVRGDYSKKIGNAHADKRGGGNKMERDMERWENRIVKHGISEEEIEELHRNYDGEYAQDL